MIAPIENGKPVETTSQTSLKESEKKKSNSTVDKDQFLQLLVAQMKYQDPLEPTSNTEYISQYATFSELEQMQNRPPQPGRRHSHGRVCRRPWRYYSQAPQRGADSGSGQDLCRGGVPCPRGPGAKSPGPSEKP